MSVTLDVASLDFEKGGGLVTVVVQDARTDALLMVAFADREAIDRTLETGLMHFHSRSRGRLWKKGESSGNVLRVVELIADCDKDAVLARCDPTGPTCHSGARTCFGDRAPSDPIRALEQVVAARAAAPPGDSASYTRKLLDDRNLRLKKLGEETAELLVALADGDRPRSAEEAADLLYHLVVALRAADLDLDAVREVLKQRAGSR